MELVISFFDYIFFRIYVFFEKKGDPIAYVKARNLTGIIQLLLLFDIILIINFFTKIISSINKKYYNQYLWGLPIAILIIILNHYRYRKLFKNDGFSSFYERWAKEDIHKSRIKGWLIFILPFILHLISHYFK